MSNCVTCGDELRPERAEKYNYCIRPECRDRNAKPLEIVAVGVNKAAEQYVALTERTKQEMSSGRYNKSQPRVAASQRRARARRGSSRTTAVKAPASGSARPRWSKDQEDLALIYRARGMKPDEIAGELGMSRYVVTQMLLAATNRGKP